LTPNELTKKNHDNELATRAAWWAQDRAKEAEESAGVMLQTPMEAFPGEFRVMEPLCDANICGRNLIGN